MPRRVNLKEICETDLEGLYRCYSNAEVMKSFGREPVRCLDEASVILNENIAMRERQEGVRYAARLDESNEFIGFITLKRYNTEHRRAEIDYLLLPEYQGQGLAFEMWNLFLETLSTEWEVERLSAYIDHDNEPSCKLVERAGFSKEGILHSWIYNGDAFEDVFLYSFLLSGLKGL